MIILGNNIECSQYQLLNPLMHLLASAPGSAAQGQFYFNTATLHAELYDGAAFRTLPFASSATPTAATIAASGSAGSNTDAARADHTHAMPGYATAAAGGFMANTDKAKLDNATSSATASTLAMRDAAGRFQAADPSAGPDVVTLQFLQQFNAGMDVKASVKVKTTGNLNLASPGTTVDGVTLANGDRVLVASQTTASQNGIYIFNGASSTMTRATDMDVWTEVPGAFTIVEQGTVGADTGWLCTSDAGGTLGTTAINFVQFGNITSYSAATDPTATGTSVYSTTVGTQFQFRAVKAGSTKTSVSLSGADILVDVNEGNLNLANLGGLLPVAKGGTGGTTPATARAGIGATGKYPTTIGDGVSLSFSIVHNLGTEDVAVFIREASGSKRKVDTSVSVTDANTVLISFGRAPAANQFRVVVVG